MVGLHVFHAHLGDRPEAVNLNHVFDFQRAVQLAELVVVFHLRCNQAVLANPGNFFREDFVALFRNGFHDPAVYAIDFFFAHECMRVFVDVALANVVISEVGAHEVIRLGTLSANTARLFHGGQVKPLVVILVDVVVIDGQESRALHVVGVAEEHNLLGIFAHIHCERGNLAFALGSALVDECHREFGTASVAIGTVVHLLDDIAAGQSFCAHHGAQGDNNCRGCFCDFHSQFLLFSENFEFLD